MAVGPIWTVIQVNLKSEGPIKSLTINHSPASILDVIFSMIEARGGCGLFPDALNHAAVSATTLCLHRRHLRSNGFFYSVLAEPPPASSSSSSSPWSSSPWSSAVAVAFRPNCLRSRRRRCYHMLRNRSERDGRLDVSLLRIYITLPFGSDSHPPTRGCSYLSVIK